MALYIPHSIFHLARLLYVRPETFGPKYVIRVEGFIGIYFQLCLEYQSWIFLEAQKRI